MARISLHLNDGLLDLFGPEMLILGFRPVELLVQASSQTKEVVFEIKFILVLARLLGLLLAGF